MSEHQHTFYTNSWCDCGISQEECMKDMLRQIDSLKSQLEKAEVDLSDLKSYREGLQRQLSAAKERLEKIGPYATHSSVCLLNAGSSWQHAAQTRGSLRCTCGYEEIRTLAQED